MYWESITVKIWNLVFPAYLTVSLIGSHKILPTLAVFFQSIQSHLGCCFKNIWKTVSEHAKTDLEFIIMALQNRHCLEIWWLADHLPRAALKDCNVPNMLEKRIFDPTINYIIYQNLQTLEILFPKNLKNDTAHVWICIKIM